MHTRLRNCAGLDSASCVRGGGEGAVGGRQSRTQTQMYASNYRLQTYRGSGQHVEGSCSGALECLRSNHNVRIMIKIPEC